MSIDLLEKAINLRKNRKFEESRQILFSLIEICESKGSLYLNIAWSYDNQGNEKEALEYYRKALNEKLSSKDEFEAILGLACTCRCLGYDQQAESIFIKLLNDYPQATEVIPFYALCLIELGKNDTALKVLFKLIVDHPPTPEISSYKNVISSYLKSMELQ